MEAREPKKPEPSVGNRTVSRALKRLESAVWPRHQHRDACGHGGRDTAGPSCPRKKRTRAGTQRGEEARELKKSEPSGGTGAVK